MGIFSELISNKDLDKNRQQKENLWKRSFGDLTERKPRKLGTGYEPSEGGVWGRSSTQDAAIEKLLTALQTRAPGGWTDDKYEQSRHFNGITYVAVHALCKHMSMGSFKVYQKDDTHQDGKRPVSSKHPLVQLLNHPNREDGFGELMYNWTLQMSLTGTSLSWIVPNRVGEPLEIYPIPTALATPQPVLSPDYPEGAYRIQPVYPYGPFTSYPSALTAAGAMIDARWMMRIKWDHPFIRYEGWSPLTALRLHIDEIESIDRSRWYSMKRGVAPSAVLNMEESPGINPLDVGEIERIRAEYEAVMMGPENAGRLFVTTPGAKLDKWGDLPKDMEYSNGWDQLSSFIIAGLGITKQAAGMLEGSSYSTLFATLKQLHIQTLQPICGKLSRGLTKQVASLFGDDLIVEIECPRIDDHELVDRKISTLMQAKAITKNEVRRMLGESTTEEEWGDDWAGADDQEDMAAMMGGGGGMEGLTQPPGTQSEQPQMGEEGDPNLPPQPEDSLFANMQTPQEDEQRAEPKKVGNSRPKTGSLNLESLGMRPPREN